MITDNETIPCPLRTFLVNNPNLLELNKFPDNSVRTAKYNIVTFLPVALAYQFTNYFNIYFLIVTIILSVKVISNMDPGVGIGPFCFVIGIALLRELLEDLKRSNHDRKYNDSSTLVYNTAEDRFVVAKWRNLKVGNIIKIFKNETIPADVLIINSSSPNGLSYLETLELDGESGLKPREALLQSYEVKDLIGYVVEVDPPNKNIYQLDGAISASQSSSSVSKHFFTVDNVLLRGGVLKNVEYNIGIVVYTGKDTKIMQNINRQNYKLSSIDKQLNRVIIYIMIFTLSICILSSLGGILTEVKFLSEKVFYLYSNNDPWVDFGFSFLKIFGAFFIVFNNIIPISLMITLEIVKVIQVLRVTYDKKLRLNKGDKMKVLSFRLHEDLGNLKYIFSDKTGTLTRNIMLFKACSIFTKLYLDTGDGSNKKEDGTFFCHSFGKNLLRKELFNTNEDTSDNKNMISNIPKLRDEDQIEILNSGEHKEYSIIDSLDRSNSKNLRNVEKYYSPSIFNNHDRNKIKYKTNLDSPLLHLSNKDNLSLNASEKRNSGNPEILKLPTFGKRLIHQPHENIKDTIFLTNECPFSSTREAILELFLNIVLNHSVLTELTAGRKVFQASNPDELTLVQAANELGVEFVEKLGNKLIIKLQNESYERTYELLHRFEFSSARLRSSVMVRQLNIPNSTIKLYIKGADSVILSEKTLDQHSMNHAYKITKEHINKFAKAGLRTLCFAVKTIREDEYEAFTEMYTQEKSNALVNKKRQIEVERLISSIETNMTLLGVTGLEDKLQENVQNDIQDFLEAGINVWMLTGDKMDTAESIAYSCKLFNEETEIFKIPSNVFNLKDTMEKILKQMEKSENISNIVEKRRTTKINLINKNIHFSPQIKSKTDREFIENFKQNLFSPRKSSDSDSDSSESKQKENVLNFNNILPRKEARPNYVGMTRNNSTKALLQLNNPFQRDLNLESEPSEVDDFSIIKFMHDNNYFNEKGSDGASIKANSIIDQIISRTPPQLNGDSVGVNNNTIGPKKIRDQMDYYKNQIVEINKKKINFFDSKKNNSSTQDGTHEILKNFGLIIEGIAITRCMEPDLEGLFLNLIQKCRSVVCCRCAPIQKSDVVNFVKSKTDLDNGVTLSIGDGGNDVNMLKAADIGVGIFGKEGSQAAYNSDYAISQFKYLRRLVFYHGRYFLMRNSYFIYYFFYKSIIYALPGLWFIFYSAYSGTLIYDDMYFLVYNAFASNILISIRAMTEEDIDMEFKGYPNHEQILELVPEIYREFRNKKPFSLQTFGLVFLLGLVHSIILFFVSTVYAENFWGMSLVVYLSVMTYQTVIIIEDTFYWSVLTIFVYLLHFGVNILFVLIRNFTSLDGLGGETFPILGDVQFWLTLTLSCILAVYPYIFIRRVGIFFFGDIVNNLRYKKFQYDIDRKKFIRKLERLNKASRSVAKFKQIYAGHYTDNNRDKRMKELVDAYKSRKENKVNNQRLIDTDIKRKYQRNYTINIIHNNFINSNNKVIEDPIVYYDFPEDIINEIEDN